LTDFSKEIKEKTHKNKQSSGPEKKKHTCLLHCVFTPTWL